MLKKKKRFIILFIAIVFVILILILIFNKQILRILKKSEHLQLAYQDVSYADIICDTCGTGNGMFKITSKEGIKKLVTYLNELELINESSEGNEYNPDWDLSHVYLYGSFPSTAISIYENYLSFSDDEDGCWDCNSTDYYIVDSEFNSESGKNKVSVFLDELTDEFGEKY